MTDSALSKLNKAAAEKAKSYKTSHDVERVHHLIAAAHLMRDYAPTSALAASLTKELTAMSLKQAEDDAKEKAEAEKTLKEAMAADNKMYAEMNEPKEMEGNSSSPPNPSSAPSVPRRPL